jgi:ABC-type glycerol-3-phosphate transport system substrate-binding protein
MTVGGAPVATLSSSLRTVVTRRVVLLGIGGSAVVLLAACGSPSPPSQPAATQGASTTTAAGQPASTAPAAGQPAAAKPATSIEGKQGLLWGLQYDPHIEAYNKLAAAFEKKTGAKLTVQGGAGSSADLTVKIPAAIAAGSGPDIACLLGKRLLPLLQRQLLVEVTPLYAEARVDPAKDFIGDSVEAYTYDGKLWGVPVEVNGVGNQVAVPVEDVDKLGLTASTPPTNGNDFFDSYKALWDLGKALTIKDASGTVKRWGLSSQGWETQSLMGLIRSQGVKWWDPDAKKFNINTDAGVNAFSLLVETPVKMGIETQFDQNSPDAALAGKVAIARGNGGPVSQGRALGYHYELAMAPPVGGALSDTDPLYVGEGGWGFIGFQAAKNKDVMMEFLRFMLTKEAHATWSQIYGGSISAMRAVNDDPAKFSDTSRWETTSALRYKKNADRTQYYGTGFGYITQIEMYCMAACADVRTGKLTAKEAAAQLQTQAEQQYTQYLDDAKKI